MTDYAAFLQSKIDIAQESGFAVSPDAVNPALKPHQRDAALWAIRGGRRALFESFGLGKTVPTLAVKHGRRGDRRGAEPGLFPRRRGLSQRSRRADQLAHIVRPSRDWRMISINIARNPPCTPKCPSRGMGCHSGCLQYAAWKAQLEEISKERRRAKEAAQGVNELAVERKEWLCRKGYRNTGGAR